MAFEFVLELRAKNGMELLIECGTVSLTRAVPTGLGWLIAPITSSLPRESPKFTLTATKKALEANAMRRYADDRAN